MFNGEVHTPIPDCFLDGITRKTVIDLAKRRGYKVIERHIKPEEMANFQECFITGTAADELPGWGWGSELLPQIEQSALFDRIDRRRPVFDPADPSLHADVRRTAVPTFTCASDTRGPTGGDGSFLIGADGKIEQAWYKISPKDAPLKLLEALR